MNKDRCKSEKGAKELGEAADFLKAISEANRLKILCLLKNGDLCVCEIWRHLKLPQNLVSHHLKVLKDNRLVAAKKDGTKIIYYLKRENFKKQLALLERFV